MSKYAIKIYFIPILSYLVYKIVLDAIYIYMISPTYGYLGLNLIENTYNVFFSYLFLIILIFLIPKDDLLSSKFLRLHFIVMIIPMLTFFSLSDESLLFMFYSFVAFVIECLVIRSGKIRFKKRKVGKYVKVTLWIVIGSIIILSMYYLINNFDINLNVFRFSDIYEIRSEQQINSRIFRYVLVWQYRVVGPFLFVYSIMKKNKVIFIFTLILQVVFYMFYPHREILLSFVFILFILFLQKIKLRYIPGISALIVGGTMVFYFIYKVFNILELFSLIPFRLIYIPAQIKFQHFDFFSQNQKLFYSEGLIGDIFGLDYPYEVSSGMLIGVNSNSNTGYLAYGYDNAGLIGMIIMTLIVVFVLKMIDASFKKNNIYALALFTYPMMTLNDNDILTTLLTGGFVLLFILAFVFLQDYKVEKKNVIRRMKSGKYG